MADHDDRSRQLRAVAITFIPLVCMTMALRCYMRAKVIRALGWDDGVMVMALVCNFLPGPASGNAADNRENNRSSATLCM
jgi:hypothetical protein